jgi:Fe-S cluster assembly ATP-binding protein
MSFDRPLLHVRDLRVDVGTRNVLKSVTFSVDTGSLVVLLGANGSGKSTLGLALAGHPRYRVVGGQARFAGHDLLSLSPEARARAGLFVSFQAPPEIPGVKNNLFIRTALNAVREARGEAPVDAFDFLGRARDASADLGLPEPMLARPVNDGFSGGERKRNELLQLALLRPRLAILDEIDSGLDIDALRVVARGVNALRRTDRAILLVTHYKRLLEYIEPDHVHVMASGRIVRSGGPELADELERTGYAWVAGATPERATAGV